MKNTGTEEHGQAMDYEMTATTMYGLEEVLAEELLKLGAREISTHNRIVNFTGDKGFMYKANLSLRTALKVLVPIHRFIANNEQRLYDGIKQIDWNEYLEKDNTLAVEATLNTDNFNHSQFVAQKTKDAIVDQFRDKFGVRPNVDLQHPTVKINVHIFRDEVTVSLDSSGPSLYKRGYREDTNLAPLKEVLAAGMIILSGWDRRTTFIDPMCGSGTLLTEAALMANNIPPGYFRQEFGFMKWKNFDKALWDTIYESAINKITDHQQTIIGIDISSNVLKKARENIKNCKAEDIVKVQCADFFEFEPPKTRGTVIINPPYGERMDKDGDVTVLYKKIGDKLKKDFSGYTAWIISSNAEAIKHIGLRPTRKITLYNGALECKFLKFELYEGTKKIHKLEKNKE
ncbi:MAG: class I SAM-dependent RNA methyltransferase [Bacteroidia bacterium]